MNRIKLTAAALLATLALASCTSGEDEPATNQRLPEGAVYLTGSIAGQTITRATLNDDGNGAFDKDDVWGMYTFADGGTLSDNTEYRYGTTVLYWENLSRTDDVTFLAHYPRQASVANPAEYDFDVAAASATDLEQADLLTARADGNRATNTATNPLRFSFEHRMHCLDIHLTAGTGVTAADLEGAKVTLLGMKSTARVDLITGKVDIGAASGDTPYPLRTAKKDPNANTASVRFIVAPQTVTKDAEWLRIQLGSDTYIYKVPALLPSPITLPDGTVVFGLVSGQCLTLNLTLIGKHEVQLTSSEIGAWTDQGTIDGDVDLADGTKLITDVAGFVAAIAADGGTAGNPVRCVLGDDIELTAEAVGAANGGSLFIETKGYKVLDGEGHTVTRTSGSMVVITSSGNAPSSLLLTDVTLDNKDVSNCWFKCINTGDWTFGDGVKVISILNNYSLIAVEQGGKLTVNGATFTCTSGGDNMVWLAAGSARTLALKDFTFVSGDIVEVYNGSNLSLRPGMGKPFRLKFPSVQSSVFAITPTAGSFTADDAKMLTIHPESYIDGSSLPVGDDYAFYLDPADGNIRLARKAATADQLKAALDKVSTDASKPTRILLTADIRVPEPTGYDDATYTLDGKQYIELDGGADGHTLTREGTKPIFQVLNGASLRLTRLTMDGQKTNGAELIMVGDTYNSTGTVTLGNGFRLTGAQAAGEYDTNGIYVFGTLVMEDGAEITGNGKGAAVYFFPRGTLHLQGGKISGNSGHGLYLVANMGNDVLTDKSIVTVDNALPSASAFDVFLQNYAKDATTVFSGAESVITTGSSYTALTDADLKHFNLTGGRTTAVGIFTTGFALRLSADRKAIGLVATP